MSTSAAGSPWFEGTTPGTFQETGSGAPSGAVDWETGITGKPATATRWPAWSEVTDGRPLAFPPSAHRHPWGDLDGIPTSFTPAPHGSTHAAGGADAIPLGGYSLAQIGGALLHAQLPASGGTWNTGTGQLYFTGGLRLGGLLGIGTDSQSNVVLRTDRFPLTGTGVSQFGLYMYPLVDGATANRAVTGRLRFGGAAGEGVCLHAQAPTFVAGASATTMIGLLVDTLAGATTNWAVYTTGVTPSYFGGRVEIDGALDHDGATAGFFGTTPVARPSLTYSRTGEAAAAAQLRGVLVALGLVADNTTP